MHDKPALFGGRVAGVFHRKMRAAAFEHLAHTALGRDGGGVIRRLVDVFADLQIVTIPRQSRGLSKCEPLKAAKTGSLTRPQLFMPPIGGSYLHSPS